MTDPARILVLLNPGSTSRNYLVGIAKAAERMGVLVGAVEMGSIWQQIAAAGAGAEAARLRTVQANEMAKLCRARSVSHVVGYTHNGVFDFGLHRAADGSPGGLFASLGVRQILLWTDHPHWAAGGSALEPQVAALLRSSMLTHVVKSEAAADELATLAGWSDVRSSTMGEDYDALSPARAVAPTHDVVLVQSDSGAPTSVSRPFLEHDDPDPRDIDEAHRASTLHASASVINDLQPPEDLKPVLLELVRTLIDARLAQPLFSWWRLAAHCDAFPSEALEWFIQDLRRWTRLTATMHSLVGWRRRFWPAWLARRVDVGLFGGPAAGRPGVAGAHPDAGAWIDYTRQPEMYARGVAALNINAGHDEEGLTHKPFQIAASAVPCIHHATVGLSDAFTLGEEALVFDRGPQLLDAVGLLKSDPARRAEMGEAMRARARRDHTWDHFLRRALAPNPERARALPVESAP